MNVCSYVHINTFLNICQQKNWKCEHISNFLPSLFIDCGPINPFYTICLQEGVRLAKWLAAEKSPIGRQRTRMRGFQNQMFGIGKHPAFHLCRSPPQDKDDRSVLFVQHTYRCIREFFPTNTLMRVCLVCTHSQHCVHHQHTLLCPGGEIPMVRDVTSDVLLQLLIDIYKGWGYIHPFLHRKTESVCLTHIVVRVLAKDYDLHLA